MTGPLADPALSALVLWLVLPAALLAGGTCFAMWRGRRGWVVVEAVIRTPTVAWFTVSTELASSVSMVPPEPESEPFAAPVPPRPRSRS